VNFHFTSKVAAHHREALERLLFFNPLQHRYCEDIERAIDRMGIPQIVVNEGSLRIRLGDYEESPSIFALTTRAGQEEIAGVIVFHRESLDCLLVLHVAVGPEYAMNGKWADELLAFRLIDHVRRVARSIKGIGTVRVIYGRKSGKMIDLSIRKPG